MPSPQSKGGRWFPTTGQLDTPEKLRTAFQQLLTQHYALRDQHDELLKKVNAPAGGAASGPPPGSGPTDSVLLGLRVAPVDVATLADGTKLTFDKKNGNFTFK